MSHRLAKLVIVLSVVTSLLILTMITFVVLGISSLQGERVSARADDCRLVKGLIYSATPPDRRAAAVKYINGTPLRDCKLYARTGR